MSSILAIDVVIDSFSLYNLAKYKDCVDAYTKALDLDPSNATIKTALEQARTKLKKEDTSVASRANETASAGGMPGFDPAALSSMLGNNPAMANMYILSSPVCTWPLELIK